VNQAYIGTYISLGGEEERGEGGEREGRERERERS